MDMTSLWGRLAKLQSFFQDGLNVDENSHLPEADLRKISLGNLYVYQQQGVLNTFETGVTPSVRKVILGEYFGITDRDSAIETLNWLSQAPSQTMFHYAYWKSHATLTLLATQDLPTFGYNMIDPLKSWCWGSILFYPFKISRFS